MSPFFPNVLAGVVVPLCICGTLSIKAILLIHLRVSAFPPPKYACGSAYERYKYPCVSALPNANPEPYNGALAIPLVLFLIVVI